MDIALIVLTHGIAVFAGVKNRERLLIEAGIYIVQGDLQVIVGFSAHLFFPVVKAAVIYSLFIKTAHIKRIDLKTFL